MAGIKGLVRLDSLAGCELRLLIVWSPSKQASPPGCGVRCRLMASITHRLLVTTCTHAKAKAHTWPSPHAGRHWVAYSAVGRHLQQWVCAWVNKKRKFREVAL